MAGNIREFEPDSPISKIMMHIHIDVKYDPHECFYTLKCKCCDEIFTIPERDVFELNDGDFKIMRVLSKIIESDTYHGG